MPVKSLDKGGSRPSFAFLVVTYNHQNYILEHLESIKYLVDCFAAEINVDLVVSDDCSRDKTQSIIDAWLVRNAGLFRNVKTIYNSANIGTCKSVENLLSALTAERCKITAGDDVYSFENIFALTKHSDSIAMVSGRALYLTDQYLRLDRRSSLLAAASQSIYKHDPLIHRFKHLSYTNAPNLFYATDCLLHPSVRSYLTGFDVTEDWPLQIAIARHFPTRGLCFLDEVLVYYRRTAGSTYLSASSRFVRDKLKIYDDLIGKESNFIERLRLQSRKASFNLRSRWPSRMINLDYYFFFANFLWRVNEIRTAARLRGVDLERHQRHYVSVRNRARHFRDEFLQVSTS